jgi:hypothetical protein
MALRQIGAYPEARGPAASLPLIHGRWEDAMALRILPHGRLQEWVAEAFGFRKVLDATFMIGFLVTGPDVTQADVTQAWTRRVFPALPEPAPYDEAVLS